MFMFQIYIRSGDMGIAERLYSKVFAMHEPKGYYELHKVQYQLPKEVQRLEVGNGECQRVTKLNARSLIGWMAAGIGIISASALVFSLIAVWKQDEKFNKEILTPARNYLRKHS